MLQRFDTAVDCESMTVERESYRVRFRCVCGETGRWFDRRVTRHALAMSCLRWSEHVEGEHGVR